MVVALGLAFVLPAINYTTRFHLPLHAALFLFSAFVLQLGLAIAPAFDAPQTNWRLVLLLWLAPYCFYAAGTGDFRALAIAKLFAIAILPLGLYRLFPVTDLERLSWQDILIASWLLVVVLSGRLKNIWNVPENLDFMNRLFLIAVAAWCWTFLRPVPRLGYRFALSWHVLRHAGLNFVYFALIGVPVSLALHFTRWHPQWHGVIPFGLDYLQIFLFVAVLEELFFRGFLQSLLTSHSRNWAVSQAIVACLFGLFHILHAPFPNWRYVLLATVAGWFYGSAYRRSGLVFTSALTHAAVDTVWRTFLSAR
ncbi:MAG TPA: CPBP family intramembrane glutamic endopeptidase [Bryobacteraceae bacterium]|nr:CPBP family intramembrane glutamic endopeptidase [Bryobacteraceae bacterium]